MRNAFKEEPSFFRGTVEIKPVGGGAKSRGGRSQEQREVAFFGVFVHCLRDYYSQSQCIYGKKKPLFALYVVSPFIVVFFVFNHCNMLQLHLQ